MFKRALIYLIMALIGVWAGYLIRQHQDARPTGPLVHGLFCEAGRQTCTNDY